MSPEGAGRAILVVDDDPELAQTLQELLAQEGYTAEVALSGAEALALAGRNPHFVLALIDLIMPLTSGLELMEKLQQRDPDLKVIIMTGYGTIENAVEAMKRGAEDYLTKPFDDETVRKKVARVMELFELRERVSQLEARLEGSPSFENIVYVSAQMARVVERAQAATHSDAAVLILGETGTGKEMLARAIHASGRRAGAPFVPVNCGALPRDLVESELFGFRRGAFTGALADTPGVFPAANAGTVFLDEIGEMPKEAQVKLLRVLQEGEVKPLGSTTAIRVDVRVISATNRPLAALRSEFLREDLFFRIATVVLEVPPLRARPDDTLVLAQHFANRLSTRYGRRIGLDRSALELLLTYSFPGNVRELEHLLEGAAALSTADPQTIADRDLKPLLRESRTPEAAAHGEPSLSLEGLERMALQRALRLCKGNRTKAASMLGISRDTLYRKLRQYGDGS